jgi:thiol-disulfide isomerase/thioredoxin
MKILTLAANPLHMTPLALDMEVRSIREKIRASSHRDSVELVSRWAVQPDDLQQALLEERPTVVHFSGHGTGAEQIVLVHADGTPRPVSKHALVRLFGAIGHDIRVVVLNACHSEPQAAGLIEVVDCAIGMSHEIGDEAATIFAAALYRGIAFGQSMKVAFDLGVNALELEGVPEERTPQLLMKAGVASDRLVLVDDAMPAGIGHTPRPILTGAATRRPRQVGEVVFCFVSWSQPCQMMMPIITSLSQAAPTGVDVKLVNAEGDEEAMARAMGVNVYPTTLFLKDGYVLKRVTGRLSERQLADELSVHFGVSPRRPMT